MCKRLIAGEEELWSQVILRAFLDATENYYDDRNGKWKRDAIEWFFSNVIRPGSFVFAAQACQENPEAFIQKFREQLINAVGAEN